MAVIWEEKTLYDYLLNPKKVHLKLIFQYQIYTNLLIVIISCYATLFCFLYYNRDIVVLNFMVMLQGDIDNLFFMYRWQKCFCIQMSFN